MLLDNDLNTVPLPLADIEFYLKSFSAGHLSVSKALTQAN